MCDDMPMFYKLACVAGASMAVTAQERLFA